MVNEIKNSLGIETVVQLKDNKINLIDGDLSKKPWIVVDENEKLFILEDAEVYLNHHKEMNKILDEALKLKLEKIIMEYNPKDYEDIEAIVLKRLQEDKDKTIYEIIEELKDEHPQLFMNFNGIESLIQVLGEEFS